MEKLPLVPLGLCIELRERKPSEEAVQGYAHPAVLLMHSPFPAVELASNEPRLPNFITEKVVRVRDRRCLLLQ